MTKKPAAAPEPEQPDESAEADDAPVTEHPWTERLAEATDPQIVQAITQGGFPASSPVQTAYNPPVRTDYPFSGE